MSERDMIRASVSGRGITRLCHFTPSRNLAHILSGAEGILASRNLVEDEAAIFNPTDRSRLDGYPDHVCCSIQYPNAWYFSKARLGESLFRDWVVILIDARYLWEAGTKFCPRNAAAARGRLVAEGIVAFEGLFADEVEGVRTYRRGPWRRAYAPTDEQAEVLIPDRVSMRDILGIVLRSHEHAANELARLRLQGLHAPAVYVVPEFFDAQRLSAMVGSGREPAEPEYVGGGADV